MKNFAPMDRKSQILAPTKKIGGKRRAYRPEQPKKDTLQSTIDSIKNETLPTILSTCSYRSGGNITTYNSANVRSIIGKNRKHICFLVTGAPTTISEGEALRDIPESIRSTLKSVESATTTADGESADVQKVE
ncbi:hypothetical protein PAEPH01_0509 [Pancytospora epiphaga]|nr:hypothetical protein PAEPH01_0509 [Pancytospora epiphaga]